MFKASSNEIHCIFPLPVPEAWSVQSIANGNQFLKSECKADSKKRQRECSKHPQHAL